MGRAIDQEKQIDILTMKFNDLQDHVYFLHETVVKIVETIEGDAHEPKKKKATKKKKTQASDGAKDSVSDK